MIRDECSGAGENVPTWRSILDRIGYPVESMGIRHSRGKQLPICTTTALQNVQARKQENVSLRVEPEAFVVDAPKLRHELYRHLQATGLFRQVEDSVVEINPIDGSYLKAGGDWEKSEAIVVCAGAASAALLGIARFHNLRQVQQVCAVIKMSTVYGSPQAFPAFIHHRPQGAWGTPASKNLPAKISSPRLCFADGGEKHFLASMDEQLRFVQSMQGLMPGLQISDIERWSVGEYAETSGETISLIGQVPTALACNGGGFKRAPSTATKLLSMLQRKST